MGDPIVSERRPPTSEEMAHHNGYHVKIGERSAGPRPHKGPGRPTANWSILVGDHEEGLTRGQAHSLMNWFRANDRYGRRAKMSDGFYRVTRIR